MFFRLKRAEDVAEIALSNLWNRKNGGCQTLRNIDKGSIVDEAITTKEIYQRRTRQPLHDASSDKVVYIHIPGRDLSFLDYYNEIEDEGHLELQGEDNDSDKGDSSRDDEGNGDKAVGENRRVDEKDGHKDEVEDFLDGDEDEDEDSEDDDDDDNDEGEFLHSFLDMKAEKDKMASASDGDVPGCAISDGSVTSYEAQGTQEQ